MWLFALFLVVKNYFLSFSVSSGFALSKLWKDFHLNQQTQITPEPGLCQKKFESQTETISWTGLKKCCYTQPSTWDVSQIGPKLIVAGNQVECSKRWHVWIFKRCKTLTHTKHNFVFSVFNLFNVRCILVVVHWGLSLILLDLRDRINLYLLKNKFCHSL